MRAAIKQIYLNNPLSWKDIAKSIGISLFALQRFMYENKNIHNKTKVLLERYIESYGDKK